MAELIKGVFPETRAVEPKKEDKPLPSYVLHIAIAFSDPLIWRRVQVPGKLTLAQLSEVIQQSMGWSNSEMHQFMIGKISYEPAMGSGGSIRISKRFDENKYTVHSVEEGMRFLFTYLYDAGDGWEHEVSLEEIVQSPPELKHSVLLAGEMSCPPEESGDIHQYHDLQTAMETPGNKDANILREMTGNSEFDPTNFDLESARKRVATLSF
jgi:hypothetical protein